MILVRGRSQHIPGDTYLVNLGAIDSLPPRSRHFISTLPDGRVRDGRQKRENVNIVFRIYGYIKRSSITTPYIVESSQKEDEERG